MFARELPITEESVLLDVEQNLTQSEYQEFLAHSKKDAMINLFAYMAEKELITHWFVRLIVKNSDQLELFDECLKQPAVIIKIQQEAGLWDRKCRMAAQPLNCLRVDELLTPDDADYLIRDFFSHDSTRSLFAIGALYQKQLMNESVKNDTYQLAMSFVKHGGLLSEFVYSGLQTLQKYGLYTPENVTRLKKYSMFGNRLTEVIKNNFLGYSALKSKQEILNDVFDEMKLKADAQNATLTAAALLLEPMLPAELVLHILSYVNQDYKAIVKEDFLLGSAQQISYSKHGPSLFSVAERVNADEQHGLDEVKFGV